MPSYSKEESSPAPVGSSRSSARRYRTQDMAPTTNMRMARVDTTIEPSRMNSGPSSLANIPIDRTLVSTRTESSSRRGTIACEAGSTSLRFAVIES